jgi:hypothetical protein
LNYEEINKNIDVLTYDCSLVSTKLVGFYKEGMICISPLQAAKSSLRDLGKEISTFGHIKHEISTWIWRKF